MRRRFHDWTGAAMGSVSSAAGPAALLGAEGIVRPGSAALRNAERRASLRPYELGPAEGTMFHVKHRVGPQARLIDGSSPCFT